MSKGGIAGADVLPVSLISPVGGDNAQPAVADGTGGGITNIAGHIGGPSCKGAPGTGSGAETELQSSGLHQPGMLFEMGIAFIDPVKQYHIFWKTGYIFGRQKYFVSPHHHLSVSTQAVAVQFFHIVEIEAQFSMAISIFFAFPHAQFERLVHIHIDVSGIGIVQQDIKQISSQLKAFFIPGINSQGKTLFLSHLVAWSRENAQKVLSFAKNGGTVALDATTGRKMPDAALYCPWPGGLAEAIGMTASDLETDYRGYELSLFGEDAGRWLLTRIVPVFSPESPWSAWDGICFKKDGAPCVWERPFGAGKFVLVNGMLGPSVLHETENQTGVKYILKTLTERSLLPVRPAAFEHGAYAMPTICEKGSLTAILSNPRTWRQGKGLHVIAPAGEYTDLWTGETVQVPATGRICLPAEDGIVLLWKP